VALVVPGGVDESGERRVIPVLLAFIERLSRRHEVRVYALGQYEEPREYGLLGARVVNLGRPRSLRALPGRTLLWHYLALGRALGRWRPDVAHAFWGTDTGWLATAVAGRLGAPSVVSLAAGELVGLPEIGYGAQLSRRTRFLVAGALRRATVVTCASGPMLEAVKAHGRVAHRVTLGVPLPDASRAAPTRGAIRTAPGAPLPHAPEVSRPTEGASRHAPPRLLFVGTLNRVKDPFTLLAAMRLIVDDEPTARLDVVGEDILGGAVQRRAAELGLGANVTFHGFLTQAELAPLYRDADLLLVTSRHEAGQVVSLEAAGWGVPSVGSHVGHMVDGAGVWAETVPPGDAPALAAAVLSLLRDPERRARLGRAAREWARTNDADATAARFEELYAELVGAHRRGTGGTGRRGW
jgi:glycosyltransferase involved in cell wall biosynthesis